MGRPPTPLVHIWCTDRAPGGRQWPGPELPQHPCGDASRVRADIDGYIKAAVRRCILDNAEGLYSLLGRSAADYPRDHLIDMLLASVNGAWTPRDDAIRATAKHLGYRKAGTAFKDAMKSALNGALRRKLIEAEGDMIRKV